MSSQMVRVVSGDCFLHHLEEVCHLESPKRVRAFQAVLQHAAIAKRWAPVPVRPANEEELAWVHTPPHIQRVARTAGQALSSFDMDTQATPGSFETACMAVGGCFSLLDAICSGTAKRGFAAVRPPGHHAEPDRAMGFCLFNNPALCARYLQQRHGAERILIVDIDVHHGNGTQAAFYGTNRVLYFSWHQFPAYPGTGRLGDVGYGDGEGFTINVPLGRGYGDRDFGRIIHHLIRPVALAYRPDMILVSCGFDLYRHDRMGGMMVSPEGYALITALLMDIAETVCGGRIVFIMEGGYSLSGIRECGLRVMQQLCGVPAVRDQIVEKVMSDRPGRLSFLQKVFSVQKKYWRIQ